MKKADQVNERGFEFQADVPVRQNIKSLKEDDRPREKLMLKGRRSLSDAELLAIIIGSGNRNQTAVELSQQILASVGNKWNALAKLSVEDLCKFKGIGEAKAISIVTALEIGRRIISEMPEKKIQLKTPEKLHQYLHSILGNLNHEEFWVILLDRTQHVIKNFHLSTGGINSTIVDVRVLMKEALAQNASALFLAHNHPSGNLEPSGPDKKLTDKVKEAAKLFDITLVDHVIYSETGYYSFHNNGLL